MKTIILALALALTAAVVIAQTNTNTAVTTTNGYSYFTLAAPTNIPPALINAEIVLSAKQIVAAQISRATLAQLEGAVTNLSAFDGGDLPTARQILLLKVRQTADVNAINQIIASLPPPVVTTNRVATVSTNGN